MISLLDYLVNCLIYFFLEMLSPRALPKISIVSLTSTKRTSDLEQNDLIQISVSGMTYVTLKTTLEKFPTTLLGNGKQRQKYYVRSRDEYFFDRHRQSFEAILYYYQSNGILICPTHVPSPIFERELIFFGLKKVFRTSPKLDVDGNGDGDGNNKNKASTRRREINKSIFTRRRKGWQRKLWNMFEKPGESLMGKILSFASLCVIICSIFILCLETMPEFNGQKPHTHSDGEDEQEAHVLLWDTLELICVSWFTLEYFLRVVSSPDTLLFLRSMQGIIDLIIVLPYLIARLLQVGHVLPLPLLKIVELVRVLRIFKFSRHSNRLRILGITLRASVRELVMLACFLFLGVLSFSTAIYFIERDHEEHRFKSIPNAFWYCLVTMGTVGYGDVVPATAAGKMIGSLCAITGVLSIALPVPIIVSTFDYYYKQDQKGGSEQQDNDGSSNRSIKTSSKQGSREDSTSSAQTSRPRLA